MFKNVELAFYDFDRTLCVHAYPSNNLNEPHPDYRRECYIQYKEQTLFQQEDMPLEYMKWFINYIRKVSPLVKEFVLTHEIFSLRDNYKMDFAWKHYSLNRYISTDSGKHKIDMMCAIADAEEFDRQDILFVDDKMDTIYAACEAGIRGLHISNVICMWEKHLKESGVVF